MKTLSFKNLNRLKKFIFAGCLSSFLILSSVQAQTTFSSADKASDTLYQVIVDKDVDAVKKMLGIENIHQLPIDKVSEKDRQAFIDGWEKGHSLITVDMYRYYIKIGESDWTFPIPIISKQVKIDNSITTIWYFDTDTGAQNITTRRIGRNELSAIQAVLAYFDAQKEYAQQDRNGDGELEYAQKFISSKYKKDGLYWSTEAGQPQSPLGPLLANREPGTAYHGYYYKILTSQGKEAEGGAYNYLVKGKMKHGFALLAWPADYGHSGVMSFMINHNGTVYEKDMGLHTAEFAELISQYNPTSSWIISMESPSE